jgi:hypothetical protein
MTAFQYGKQKLFDVIGIPDVRWGMDGSGRTTVYAGLQATAAEFAKYGYLLLNNGKWDGKQVIPVDWIERTTKATKPCEDWNQWLWHVNLPLRLRVRIGPASERQAVVTLAQHSAQLPRVLDIAGGRPPYLRPTGRPAGAPATDSPGTAPGRIHARTPPGHLRRDEVEAGRRLRTEPASTRKSASWRQ